MKKNWYQIDRRQESGELDRYDMIKSTSLENALQEYLGSDFSDYTVTKVGKTLKAECPQETSIYLEVLKCK